MKLRYVILLTLLVLTGLALGCAEKPSSDKAPGDHAVSEGSKGPTAEAPKPDFVVEAKSYAEEFKKNPTTAKAKYAGKTIEIAGMVASLARDDAGNPYLLLEGDEPVQCFVEGKDLWTKHGVGQKLSVRGTADQFGNLRKCTIAQAGPNPTITLTSEQLGKELSGQYDAAVRKYDNKSLIISGRLIGKQEDKAGDTIELQSDGKTKIKCLFGRGEKPLTERLQSGQNVRVYGEFTRLRAKEGEVVLQLCMLLDSKE